MSKKLYALITGLVDAAAIAGTALLAFFQPTMYGAFIAAIGKIEIGRASCRERV